ncbi:MAG: hypothetical protein H7336_03510 [Bacteriovorax sp.]|nr:hypothetical protein [Bacteriovorax sp.]
MKKLSSLINHLVIISALCLASCGYISDKPVENADVYRINELQTCKIDVSKLSEIFKANQTEQIRCLQENFIQFTKYVRAKHPGSVSEDELGIFVKRFFEGQSDAIINGISLIFQLNMILLKDEADRISHQNISPLFELLIKVNQEAVILSNIIKAMDEPKNQANFWELRRQFNESTNRFASAAVGVIEKAPGFGQKLNMRQFVIDMSKKIGDHQVNEDTIDSFIFMKKMLVGGDEEIITTDELKDIISRLPKILGLVFDIYYVKGENFKNQASEIRFYVMAIRDVYGLVKFNQPNFELVNSTQLVKIAERFLKNYDVDSFKPSIEALKAKFIGGKKDSVTLIDLDTILLMFHDFYEKVYFVHLTYDEPENFKKLSGTVPLTTFEQKAIAGYEDFTPARVNQLHASFADTATVFRYFRDVSGSASYNKEILRNKKGFIEVNVVKWLSWKLLKAYGHTDAKGEMQISMDEFANFLLDSKPLLEEFKLWSPNFQTFSRNSILLADLFQQQSNGDMNIDINESTEFIGMLLTATDVSGKFTKSLTNLCDAGINSDDPVFETSCFNGNFYNVILKNLGYSKSFPLLQKYLHSTSKAEGLDYLIGVEGFARDNNSPGVPVNRRDATLIMGAMVNIETTFIRFDKNLDNIIDYDELSKAFLVYRSSIISLSKLPKEKEVYAKAIFMYMVSKMEVPKMDSIFDQFWFWRYSINIEDPKWRMKNPIEAKRLNIGNLLYYMVNQPTPESPVAKK